MLYSSPIYFRKKNIIRKFHVVVLQGRQMKKSNVRAEVFFWKLFFEQFQYIRTFGLNGNCDSSFSIG